MRCRRKLAASLGTFDAVVCAVRQADLVCASPEQATTQLRDGVVRNIATNRLPSGMLAVDATSMAGISWGYQASGTHVGEVLPTPAGYR
jgi:hypothetical protein